MTRQKDNVCCGMCGVLLDDGSPYYEDNSRICMTCSMRSAEFFVELNLGGMMLFWLEGLIYKFFRNKLKKRLCYIPLKIRQTVLDKYKYTCQKNQII